MEDLASEIKQLFYDDYLIEAYQKLKDAEIDPEVSAALEELEESKIIRNTIGHVDSCLKELGDLDSFRCVYENDDIATFYKGSGSNCLLRAEMVMPLPFFPITALFSEVDMYHTWIDQINDFDVIGEPTKFIKLLRYKLKLPWPLAKRDVAVCCQGVVIGANRSALIVLRDHDSSFLGIEPPPIAEGEARISIPFGCINIMYKGPEETQVSLIVNVLPKIKLIPQSIINWAGKHVLYYFMDMIKNMVQQYPGSEYERRVLAKPEYYEEIRGRIHKYFESS